MACSRARPPEKPSAAASAAAFASAGAWMSGAGCPFGEHAPLPTVPCMPSHEPVSAQMCLIRHTIPCGTWIAVDPSVEPRRVDDDPQVLLAALRSASHRDDPIDDEPSDGQCAGAADGRDQADVQPLPGAFVSTPEQKVEVRRLG